MCSYYYISARRPNGIGKFPSPSGPLPPYIFGYQRTTSPRLTCQPANHISNQALTPSPYQRHLSRAHLTHAQQPTSPTGLPTNPLHLTHNNLRLLPLPQTPLPLHTLPTQQPTQPHPQTKTALPLLQQPHVTPRQQTPHPSFKGHSRLDRTTGSMGCAWV